MAKDARVRVFRTTLPGAKGRGGAHGDRRAPKGGNANTTRDLLAEWAEELAEEREVRDADADRPEWC